MILMIIRYLGCQSHSSLLHCRRHSDSIDSLLIRVYVLSISDESSHFHFCIAMGSGKQLTDAQRGAIVELKRAGLSHKMICIQLKVSKSAVSKILKRYNMEGNFSVRSRCGRPSKVSKHTKRRMKKVISADPFLTSNDLIREVSPLRCVSTETVSRVLRKDFNLWARKVQRKPLMTKAHLQKRKEFCMRTKDWTADDWGHIMWSDESNFYLFDQSRWRVRRPKQSDPSDHRFTQPTVKHPPHVMVWVVFPPLEEEVWLSYLRMSIWIHQDI